MVELDGLAVPLTDRTLTDQVVRQLRKQIILGHLGPGERLIEVRLADQLAVSRSTVREALRRLEAESLVETVSHRGSRVARLELADAFEVCELHALLQADCVRRTPLPIDPAYRDTLEQIARQMSTLQLREDVDRFIDLDTAFHRTVVEASGRHRVLQVWSGINSLLGILVALALRYLDLDSEVVAARHWVFIEALSHSDREAAVSAVSDHYRSLESDLKMIASMRQAERQSRTV